MRRDAPWMRSDPAEDARREQKENYARELQAQMKQNQGRRDRDRLEREAR